MTIEDRRLVAALTTEVCEQRRVLEALVAEIERLCDHSVKNPNRIPAYREAKEMLK